MRSNKELVKALCQSGVLKTPRIIEAFESIDRRHFVPSDLAHEAYVDAPLPIGDGQTISQPWTVAFMLELLQPNPGDKVLDIGSGSGWTTALLAQIVGEKGTVLGLERQSKLVSYGAENLQKLSITNAQIQNATDVLGAPGEKFDAILVSASASEIPEVLFDQLGIAAHLVIPVQHAIYLFEKTTVDEIRHERYDGFVFVPLVY